MAKPGFLAGARPAVADAVVAAAAQEALAALPDAAALKGMKEAVSDVGGPPTGTGPKRTIPDRLTKEQRREAVSPIEGLAQDFASRQFDADRRMVEEHMEYVGKPVLKYQIPEGIEGMSGAPIVYFKPIDANSGVPVARQMAEGMRGSAPFKKLVDAMGEEKLIEDMVGQLEAHGLSNEQLVEALNTQAHVTKMAYKSRLGQTRSILSQIADPRQDIIDRVVAAIGRDDLVLTPRQKDVAPPPVRASTGEPVGPSRQPVPTQGASGPAGAEAPAAAADVGWFDKAKAWGAETPTWSKDLPLGINEWTNQDLVGRPAAAAGSIAAAVALANMLAGNGQQQQDYGSYAASQAAQHSY